MSVAIICLSVTNLALLFILVSNMSDTDKSQPKPQFEKIKAVPDADVSQRGSAHIIYPDLPPVDMVIDSPEETTESSGEPKKD